jgi:DNA-binding IclR family transcriptional regulator
LTKNSEVKVKSLQKALEILNCFVDKPTLGVTEISEKLDLYKSNVHNILSTFEAMDFLEQDPESGKYRLGIGIFSLCKSLGDNFSVTKIALPYMQEISNSSNERAYLAIPQEDEVIYLDSTYPAESFNLMRTIIGERAKMYCTGIGKAMLAYLSPAEIDEYASRELEKHTENTITDKQKLIEELATIRQNGYALDNMEHEFGIKCIAMPIFNKRQQVEAAISISGPSLRFSDERIPELVELLRANIRKIQSRI